MSRARKPAVLVMAKAPLPGKVKTRLHPLLGPERCARLQSRLIQYTTAVTRAARLRTYVAYDPTDAYGVIKELVPPRAPGCCLSPVAIWAGG
ncbi:hypothetical protein SSP35_04_00350 [Streptomyces sp. NBRC 110611]|uniref:hypothetical protein n=1 Tax=Streptomyces sp. NBRC 110611 TaxID=1621259 RepID=UPI00085801E1|nr:hypothetical protein [Streptomyces sp. NBRC 110611]GAU66956.1 hypothetical protein SSP35_04_00350 [Streptomyces sp. NBRC 110611]